MIWCFGVLEPESTEGTLLYFMIGRKEGDLKEIIAGKDGQPSWVLWHLSDLAMCMLTVL